MPIKNCRVKIITFPSQCVSLISLEERSGGRCRPKAGHLPPLDTLSLTTRCQASARRSGDSWRSCCSHRTRGLQTSFLKYNLSVIGDTVGVEQDTQEQAVRDAMLLLLEMVSTNVRYSICYGGFKTVLKTFHSGLPVSECIDTELSLHLSDHYKFVDIVSGVYSSVIGCRLAFSHQ